MMKKEMGCRERLIDKRDGEHTKKTERKIAAYLLGNFDKSLHSTLLELAAGCPQNVQQGGQKAFAH